MLIKTDTRTMGSLPRLEPLEELNPKRIEPESGYEFTDLEPSTSSNASRDPSSYSLSSQGTPALTAPIALPEESHELTSFSEAPIVQIPEKITLVTKNGPSSRQPNQMARILQRILTGNANNDSNTAEATRRSNQKLKKAYNDYVVKTGKRADFPPLYRDGMQLLGNAIFAPLDQDKPIISKKDLIKNSDAYFSKDELPTLKNLQTFLLDRLLNAPLKDSLQEHDWWALEQLFCITPPKENRAVLLNIAKDFQPILLKDKNQGIHTLRHDLKAADRAQAPKSNKINNTSATAAESTQAAKSSNDDNYQFKAADSAQSIASFYSIEKDYNDSSYRSRWEITCDEEFFEPLSDTLAKIKEAKTNIASLLRKWSEASLKKKMPSSFKEHDTTSQINNPQGGTSTLPKISKPIGSPETAPLLQDPSIPKPSKTLEIPEKSKQLKYDKELKGLTAYEKKLEEIHDNLFSLVSTVFADLEANPNLA